MKKKKIIIVSIVSIVVIAVAVALIFVFNRDKSQDNKNIDVSEMEKINVLSEDDSAKAAELIKQNIVKITNEIDENTKIIGTGFFHESGYLVTNSHVVDIEGKITVEYADGEKVEGILVSNDITSDIALISVENPKVLAMSFGNTLKLKVTDEVYGIGYAYGLEGEASVTKGILSARRSAGGIEFLQTDASLNSGNSGGPLVNAKAELLGINTYATDNASIAMSISSESLEILINKLIKEKKENYLEDTREQNALSVVLKEIGHEVDDIYGEKDIIKNKFHKHEEDDKEENKEHNSGGNSGSTTPDYSSKSGNSRLASLKIEGHTINFDPDRLSYVILLRNSNSSKINITAVPQESESTVEIKQAEIQVGKSTTIDIDVLAPNRRNGHTYNVMVIKPLDILGQGRLNNIRIQTELLYNSSKGENCFKLYWYYRDRDGVEINSSYDNITAIVSNYTVELYYGRIDANGDHSPVEKPSRLLKTYNFNGTGIDTDYYEYNYGMPREQANIPISEIRNLLNDDDYVDGSAPITFKITVNTYHQGSFVGYSGNSVNK